MIKERSFVLHGDLKSTVCGMADILEEAKEINRRLKNGEELPSDGSPCLPKYRTIQIVDENGEAFRIQGDIPYED